ncbi:MAG: glycogen/starch/alpha-glucan phosphorylase [Lachnospiraceae bacterium]|nr:glycogen/starch/alpha-glucan phosphorylase [Lachnospiraceae bacterium]
MSRTEFNKEQFKQMVATVAHLLYRKNIKDATPEELFAAVAYTVRDLVNDDWIATQEANNRQDGRILYYMSMEFLMGRALGNMLINAGCSEEVREALAEMGIDLNLVEDQEADPALGNGGLGRLAACFLDSLATLGYSAYGCGIRYRYGMFAQRIIDGYQVEVPDNWLKNPNPFEIRRTEYACEVKFGGRMIMTTDENGRNHFDLADYDSVIAIPYDMPVVGYGSGVVDTLRIWDAQAVEDFNLDSFEQGHYEQAVAQQGLANSIVQVLYPNDNHYGGKKLRLKQQYFFISATLQTAIKKYKSTHNGSLEDFEKHVVFQMNDTHPSMTVAELMRLLMDQEKYEWNDAWNVVTQCVAYTNHTIMAEALEKWPIDLFSKLLPRVFGIIAEINRRFVAEIRARFPGDEDRVRRMEILHDGQIRMAYLAIVGSYSVNGVAALHTKILKEQELRDFYEMWPEKFHNMTNGITQRRFLGHGNPLLASFVTKRIGDGWMKDLSKMRELEPYINDPASVAEFASIKRKNKERLAAYILEHNEIAVDPDSIFDVQVKRLHEYKRQLMNILHIMMLYNRLRDDRDFFNNYYPHTFIFGAKAASGYARAKLTIKLINAVADVINNDESIEGKIKVVFIEDYKVSNAEIIIAAADISEQISTASKEASGTSNMKFMLNGAPTIGTMDGANIEIVEEVGEENAFIFGCTSDEIIRYEKEGGYDPLAIYYNSDDIRIAMLQLVNGTYSPEDPNRFREIYDSLLYGTGGQRPDTYFILKDMSSYHKAHMRVNEAYKDREGWTKMAMLQTARSGKFSSDRTISEYVNEIWHLNRLEV